MGLTSPRDEREAVAWFQKLNASQLVTKLITQELLKVYRAHWNWNYNRAASRGAQGEKLNKQALPAGSETGGMTHVTAGNSFPDLTMASG